jgi:hypothetical protein
MVITIMTLINNVMLAMHLAILALDQPLLTVSHAYKVICINLIVIQLALLKHILKQVIIHVNFVIIPAKNGKHF